MQQKNKEVYFQDSAKEEIKEIFSKYMKLVGPKSARRIYTRIIDSIMNLRIFPNMGIAIDEEEIGESGYRKLICGNYLIFYRIVDEVIYIYHVADGRNEYKQLFKS